MPRGTSIHQLHREGRTLTAVAVNGQHCEGTFGIQARIETDLLLNLTDDGCRIEALGSHPEGGSHAEEPEPYGLN